MHGVRFVVSSLPRPSDAIWRQKYWTTMAQIMFVFCLMAPSHYLHQVWLDIIASIPVHFHRKWARYACKYSVSSFKIKFLKIVLHLLRRDEVTTYIQRDIYHSLLQLTPLFEFAISHMINSMSVSVRSFFCFIAHASLDTELKTVHSLNIDYRSEIHLISTDTIDANVIFYASGLLACANWSVQLWRLCILLYHCSYFMLNSSFCF